ncbi:ATP-binding protein [Corynebacterium lehmanniae]
MTGETRLRFWALAGHPRLRYQLTGNRQYHGSVTAVPTTRAQHATTAHLHFNILSEREGNRSTIVTSQFTPQDWYRSIPDAVIAESILNRLIAGAEIITLEGPNMRLETNQ